MTSVKSKKTKQIGIDGSYDKWQAGSFVDLNDKSFAFKNGLWKGKSNKLSRAVVIRGANFRPNGKMDSGELLELFVDVKQLSDRKLVEGDILIERSGGGPKQPVGRVAYFDMENAGIDYSFSNFTTRLRILDKKRIYPKFIFYRLLHFYATALGANFQSGSTGIRNLDFSKYKTDAKIPLLGILEQKKIAGVFSELQKAVENQEKIISGLRELKAATMSKFFREGLRGEPLKNTEIGEMPEGWDVKTFGEFVTLQRGHDLPVQMREPGDIPVIGSNGVVGYHKVGAYNGPGVLTGRSGTIGLSFYVLNEYWPLNTALFVSDFHGNSPKFVHYFFQQFNFKKYSGGVSVPTLNRNLVHSAVIAFPKLEEQQDIAKILSKIDESIAQSSSKVENMQNLFSSALNQLMTGKVRIGF